MLVKNSSNITLYLTVNNGGSSFVLNGEVINISGTAGRNIKNYNQSELSYDTVNYPTYIKYHLICLGEGRFDTEFLMNVNFGKIYSR